MPGAARILDPHICPAVNVIPPAKAGGFCSPTPSPIPKPHVGGTIVQDGSPDVFINGKKAVRCGDQSFCTGVTAMDVIVTGAAEILINGRLAVMQGSKNAHGATVGPGSTDVIYGSAMAGATFGDSGPATKACQEAAAGRGHGKADPNDQTQSKAMNCGHESIRQICIQMCDQGKTPKNGPGCKACTTSEDDWYRRYMDMEKDKHNAVVAPTNTKIRAMNDTNWATVKGAPKAMVREERVDRQTYISSTVWVKVDTSGGWEPYQDQTIYLYDDTTVGARSSSQVRIYKLWGSIDNPEQAAKDGNIGSFPETRQDMLEQSCGLKSSIGKNDEHDIASNVADGKMVIASVDVGTLNGEAPQGLHAVTVSQMKYDADGHLVEVTVNDTGNAANPKNCCGRVFSGADVKAFQSALNADGQTNVI